MPDSDDIQVSPGFWHEGKNDLPEYSLRHQPAHFGLVQLNQKAEISCCETISQNN